MRRNPNVGKQGKPESNTYKARTERALKEAKKKASKTGRWVKDGPAAAKDRKPVKPAYAGQINMKDSKPAYKPKPAYAGQIDMGNSKPATPKGGKSPTKPGASGRSPSGGGGSSSSMSGEGGGGPLGSFPGIDYGDIDSIVNAVTVYYSVARERLKFFAAYRIRFPSALFRLGQELGIFHRLHKTLL